MTTLMVEGIDTLHTSLVHYHPRTGPGGAERPWPAQVESHEHSLVRGVCRHGIGRRFHKPPNVLLFGRPGEAPVLQPGILFTIEPMVNAGRPEMNVPDDRWTAATCDPDLSAQFEPMVGATEAGLEMCTLSPAYFDRPPPQK